MPLYDERLRINDERSVGPAIIKHGDVEIKEFPVTIKKIAGKNLIFSGGGYFRLFPYSLIKRWSKEAEQNGYLLSYIHPRDLDGGQPKLEGLPLVRKFKSYVDTKGAAKKLEQYLTDFWFTDVRTAVEEFAWENATEIRLDD